MSEKFEYDTVFNQMTPLEIDKANMALDLQNEAEERAAKKAARKKR